MLKQAIACILLVFLVCSNLSISGENENRNNPPDQPIIPSGPITGHTNISYNYSTSTIDPDGDLMFYLFDWDDGTDWVWYGPYSSGEIVNRSHSWTNTGTYQVKVKAKDNSNAESNWSELHNVTITSQPRGVSGNIYTYYGQPVKYLEIFLEWYDIANNFLGYYETITNDTGNFTFIVDCPIDSNFLIYIEGDYTAPILSGNIIDGMIYNDITLDVYYEYRDFPMSSKWTLIAVPCYLRIVGGGMVNGYAWDNATTSNNPTGGPIVESNIFLWFDEDQYYQIVSYYWIGRNDGCWIYCYEPCNIVFLTKGVPCSWSVHLYEGWNCVGGQWYDMTEKDDFLIDYDVNSYNWSKAVDNGIISDFVFGWDTYTQMYYLKTFFDSQEGYWIYAFDDCVLSLNL